MPRRNKVKKPQQDKYSRKPKKATHPRPTPLGIENPGEKRMASGPRFEDLPTEKAVHLDEPDAA